MESIKGKRLELANAILCNNVLNKTTTSPLSICERVGTDVTAEE